MKDKTKTKAYIKKMERREVNRLFKMWRDYIIERDKMCIICGRTDILHAHHIIPRENKEFRFDSDNGVTLCPNHHKFSLAISPHRNPMAFFKWMEIYRKDQMDILYMKYKVYEMSQLSNI